MSLDCPLRDDEATWLRGLPPVLGPRPRVLILGSMPGPQSLLMGQYYAHPRNAFWRIAEDVLGVPRTLPYPDRLDALCNAGVALWDVLGACVRHGALDSGIERATMVPNDIEALLAARPTIGRIVFNGVMAETVFRTRIGPADGDREGIALTRAPSTSPANASQPYEEKRAAWRAALAPVR